MSDYTKDIDKQLKKIGEQCVSEIRDALADTGTNASGRTSASLHVVAGDGVVEVWGRPAFGTVEHGRRAGRVPRNFRAIIARWITNKGISVQPVEVKRVTDRDGHTRALLRMAGAIAWKIRTEGSRLHREGGRKDIYTPAVQRAKEAVEQYFSNVAVTILD